MSWTALRGTRHGGLTALVAALFDEAARCSAAAVLARQKRGERLPGFGQPLYPAGDIRATALLAHLRDGPEAGLARALAAAVLERADLRPNVDFALAALARSHRLPAGAPLALFAIGRSVGWLAHAEEQYRDGRLIRPRARYVGEAPRR